jgi:hypothetical protein
MTNQTQTIVATPTQTAPVVQVNTITIQKLIDSLQEHKGTQFVTLITKTQPKLLKNPLEPIFKVSRVNICVNWNYSNSVNLQRMREGNEDAFVPQPRKWGTRIPHSPFVEHKGQLYLEAKIEKSLDYHYENANGDTIENSIVNPYLPQRKQSSTQQTEKEIILRDYNVENIVSIAMQGETYLVIR